MNGLMMTMGTRIWTQKNNTMWDIFDNWTPPAPVKEKPALDWSVFDKLIPTFRKISKEKYERLLKLLDQWDEQLADYGRDPTHYNWRNFRPLRLSREEDWSDWLTYLIDSSETGSLAGILFGKRQKHALSFSRPTWICREDIQHGYRADIIIKWRNNSFTHVEVKIGDPHLGKTHVTGRKLKNKYRAEHAKWDDFILLLSDQLQHWDAVVEADNSNADIEAITWDDVCVAIRRSLLSNETITWKALAYVFLGSVEQRIIGFPGHRIKERPVEQLDEKLEILTKGLTHEK